MATAAACIADRFVMSKNKLNFRESLKHMFKSSTPPKKGHLAEPNSNILSSTLLFVLSLISQKSG
jgi:hypothetical protein